ncbi:hypothetical protein AAFF_G00226320 [Aldrovandia affinis]|uniref:Uncharacterized protein n=1 Tax=Aldrovandia affinis TaxID=143900 RepID=A0AAD7TB94_9TELE|nr:hypothetical protein AAFF_G00226320 [Aldrovandia affinis]
MWACRRRRADETMCQRLCRQPRRGLCGQVSAGSSSSRSSSRNERERGPHVSRYRRCHGDADALTPSGDSRCTAQTDFAFQGASASCKFSTGRRRDLRFLSNRLERHTDTDCTGQGGGGALGAPFTL